VIEPGDVVTVHYSLAAANGAVVESTFGAEPESFRYGKGEFPAALERRLASLAPGELAEFSIAPSEMAFGPWDASRRHVVPRDRFEGVDCAPGSLVEFTLPNGERVSGRIESVDGDDVVVDFNNPLAGREVQCRLQLVSVDKPETVS